MPSLADIPPDLLFASRREDFFQWLIALPITPDTRKELLYLWGQAINAPLTASDYARVLPPDW